MDRAHPDIETHNDVSLPRHVDCTRPDCYRDTNVVLISNSNSNMSGDGAAQLAIQCHHVTQHHRAIKAQSLRSTWPKPEQSVITESEGCRTNKSRSQRNQDQGRADAEQKKRQYRGHRLRAKGLPLSYVSQSHEIWTSLQDMLQKLHDSDNPGRICHRRNKTEQSTKVLCIRLCGQ